MVAKCLTGSWLDRAGACKYCFERFEQDDDISHEGPVFHIVEIKPDAFLPGEVRSATDLPEAAHAGANVETPVRRVVIERHLSFPLGALHG